MSELANGLESGCRAPPDAIALHCDGQRTPCMVGARRGGSLLCHAELCTLVRSLPPPTWRALRPTVNVQTQPYRFTLWHRPLFQLLQFAPYWVHPAGRMLQYLVWVYTRDPIQSLPGFTGLEGAFPVCAVARPKSSRERYDAPKGRLCSRSDGECCRVRWVCVRRTRARRSSTTFVIIGTIRAVCVPIPLPFAGAVRAHIKCMSACA